MPSNTNKLAKHFFRLFTSSVFKLTYDHLSEILCELTTFNTHLLLKIIKLNKCTNFSEIFLCKILRKY